MLQLDVCVQLGSFWNSNPAPNQQQSERESKIQTFVNFLKTSADNGFQGKEFQGEKSVGSSYKAPWRGAFPRNPLLSTVRFEVVGDHGSETVNQLDSAPIQLSVENLPINLVTVPAFHRGQDKITQDSQIQIENEIKNRSGERIESENSLRTTEYTSTGADFLFQPPTPSAPTLQQITGSEGQNQASAGYQA